MKINFTQIKPYQIYHVNFPTQYELCMTLLRFQEYYESPKFRNKVFTWEEYIDWYVKTFRDFTYYRDWSGFNCPSTAIDAVRERFEGHTKRETKFINFLRNKGLEGKKYYLIGTYGNNLSVLRHEIAHGLFFSDSKYRDRVSRIVKKHRVASLRRWLFSKGYCKAVLTDEIQAYALTGYPRDLIITKEMESLRKELKVKVGHYLKR